MTAIAEGTDPQPGFAEGLSVQRVLAAVERALPAEQDGSASARMR